MISTYKQNLSRLILCGLVGWFGFAAGYLLTPRTPALRESALHSEPSASASAALLDRQMGETWLPGDISPLGLAYLINNRTNASAGTTWDETHDAPIMLHSPPMHLHSPTAGQLLRTVQRFDEQLAFTDNGETVHVWGDLDGPRFSPTCRYRIDDLLGNRTLFEAVASEDREWAKQMPNPLRIEEYLRKLITDNIAPQTWRDNGGKFGSLHVIDNELMVTELPEVQNQIADLLEVLRRIADAQRNSGVSKQ